MLLLINVTFKGVFGNTSGLFGKLSGTGLKNFWSYPVMTLCIHYSKYYLVISSDDTNEFSEWQVCSSGSLLLTSN